MRYTDFKFVVTIKPSNGGSDWETWADSKGQSEIEQREGPGGLIEKVIERREFLFRFENGQRIKTTDAVVFQGKEFVIQGIFDPSGDRRFIKVDAYFEETN